MKKFVLALTFVLFSAGMASAQYDVQPEDKTVEELDVLKTCNTPAKKESAEKVLNFLSNFKWWHIKNMVDALHPEYVHWHASRVYNAVVTPEDKWDKLPYGKGIVERSKFLEDLAMVAYTNNVARYINDIKRLECAANDMVVISVVFHGLSVFRNPQGYITHQYQLKDIPVRFTYLMKDGLVYRTIFDLADSVTVDLFKKIRELVTTTPPMAPDEATRTTYQEVLAKFKKEAGVN